MSKQSKAKQNVGLLEVDNQLLQQTDVVLSRGRVIKNLLMLGLSFFFIIAAYQGLAALQSSFNSEGGLGTAGLAVTYGSLTASSLAVAPMIIGLLGPKRTMSVVLIGYLGFICTNLYPHWGTIIPASVMLGFCGGPLWASMGVYMVRLAADFAKASGSATSSAEGPTSVFFGVFYAFIASSFIFGNLISYLTLSDSQDKQSNKSGIQTNLTCGHRFCSAVASEGAEHSAEKPPMYKFYIMMGCFISAAVLSILVMLLLVDRTDIESDRRRFSLLQLRDNLKAMWSHMIDPLQLLLIILTVNIGLSQSFIVGEFTEAFVACSSGIASVGRVMICYGAGLIVSGIVFGQLAGLVGKIPVLIGAAFVQITLEMLALFWQVQPEPAWLFYVFAGVWGCNDNVWNSQMNALYGDYFAQKTDSAFSAYRFWESVGYIIGFSYNKLFCVDKKLYIMLGVVCAGFIGLVFSFFINRKTGTRRFPRETSQDKSEY